MNEALQFSKLASGLLRNLQEVSESTEEDDAVHAQSIELILDAFSSVDRIISLRKPEEPDEHQLERPNDDDDPVN